MFYIDFNTIRKRALSLIGCGVLMGLYNNQWCSIAGLPLIWWLYRLTKIKSRAPIVSTRKYTAVSPIDGVVERVGLCVMGNRIHNHIKIRRSLLSNPIQYMPIDGELYGPLITPIDAPQLYQIRTNKLTMSIRSPIGVIYILQNGLQNSKSWLHCVFGFLLYLKLLTVNKCGSPLGLFPISKTIDVIIPSHLMLIVGKNDKIIGGVTPIAVTCRDYSNVK